MGAVEKNERFDTFTITKQNVDTVCDQIQEKINEYDKTAAVVAISSFSTVLEDGTETITVNLFTLKEGSIMPWEGQ